MKTLIRLIYQRTESSAKLLVARELTFGYQKNWKNYCLAEKSLTLHKRF